MLVLVEGSQLAAAAPDLPFILVDGVKALPLHTIILFYGRLLWPADDVLDTDLAALVGPAKLAAVESWAVADGRLDFSPCSATELLQRICALAGVLSPPYPADLTLALSHLVPLEPHAIPDDMEASWHVRMPIRILHASGLLGPYADYIRALGPLIDEGARSDADGRAHVVAAALTEQAATGAMSAFASDFDNLGGIVAEFLRSRMLPAAFHVAELRWPALLTNIDALVAYADPTRRGAVVATRFPTALNLMTSLRAAVAGEPPSLQYDMPVGVLAQLIPSQASATPSLACFYVLNRHIATERFDLSAGTAVERIAAMGARSVRDATIERCAPWGGGSGGTGSAAGKVSLDVDIISLA